VICCTELRVAFRLNFVGDFVMLFLFEPRARVIRDERELRDLSMRYGEHAKSVLYARADDARLLTRERKHWRRLARKMPRFQARESIENAGNLTSQSH
jgi:hypothetical protein